MLFGSAGLFLIMTDTYNNNDPSLQFSRNFLDWYKTDFLRQGWLKDHYVRYDESAGIYRFNVNFNAVYRAFFPNLEYNGVLEQENPQFYDTGMLIELTWGELIEPAGREAFSQLVNLRLQKYNAPLVFQNGRFINPNANKAPANNAQRQSPGQITMAHKIAAALFIVLVLLAVLKGC